MGLKIKDNNPHDLAYHPDNPHYRITVPKSSPIKGPTAEKILEQARQAVESAEAKKKR